MWWNTHIQGTVSSGRLLREGTEKLINPLLACDVGDEKAFPELSTLKTALQQFVDSEKKAHNVTTMSIYLRTLNRGRWVGVNVDERYTPASLLKLGVMMAYLKSAEGNSPLLSQQITYNGSFDLNSVQTVKPKLLLTKGVSYTVEDLLFRGIAYSDNNAMQLLQQHLTQDALNDVYKDLSMPIPSNADTLDFLSPRVYAIMFQVLYSATYLDKEMSERALEMLSGSEFTQGIPQGVPQGTRVAHKFGERSDADTPHNRELHDCGIIYYPQHPYLLCIMTKGDSFTTLLSTITRASQLTYTQVQSLYTR